MGLASSAWAVFAAAALLGAAGAALVVARRPRSRRLGAAMLLLCLLGGGAALFGYRRSARAERIQRRYYAGLDDKRHGNLEDAEREMREVLALDPGHRDAKQALAELARAAEPAPRRQAQLRLQSAGKGTAETPSRPMPFHKPSDVGISRYTLDLALYPDQHTLQARATLELLARRGTDRIELALSPEFQVERVFTGGAPALYSHTGDLLTISTRLRKEESASVVVAYHRRAKASLLAGGDLIDPRGVYLRPESRWYPSAGELDFHAPLQVSVRVPRGMTAVCAGRMAGKDVGSREVTYHWNSPQAAQMICLAAGRYTYRRSAGGPAPVETYLYPRHARKAPAYHEEAERILRFYADRFGAYAYPKLAIAEIPVFPGGYGSTSLLLLTEESFAQKRMPAAFLAHEIAHQWWGNQVAPQGPGAGWMSEAFAEYSSLLYQERVGGRRALKRALKEIAGNYQESVGRGVEQAIAETDPYQQSGAYEGVIYYKGAYVLHSLRSLVGDDAFRRILRAFAGRYGGKRAGIADFEKVAAEEYGRPLQWFCDQWLRRRGAPRLRYAVAVSGGQATLTVAQEGEPYRGEMDVVVADRAGRSRHKLQLGDPTTLLRFPASGEVSVDFDPDNWWLQYTPRWVKVP